MLDIVLREEYGYLPEKPEAVKWTVGGGEYGNFCAGKATWQKVSMTVTLRGKEFTFPFDVAIPGGAGPYPFFVQINFVKGVPNKYLPIEEIIDMGYAVLAFCYEDVTSDNADFTNGLAGILYPDGKRQPTDAGKLSIWAWAAQRVLDYAETEPRLDMTRAGVCGHSRLGKTALLCGATDHRFKFVYSNDSGCSGAAITRDKVGEDVAYITDKFPYWFCENYKQYAEREHEMPFDQHWLLACVAPNYVSVGSAVEDTWADPDSEMLSCVAASEFYKSKGLAGFACADRLPKVGDIYHTGSIGYHLRGGAHFFSREDWQKLILFARSK